MYKKLLSFLFSLTFVFTIQGQTQSQFENASFEDWEEIQYGSVPEPVDWSSIRTCDPDNLAQVAPAVWGPSDDAHTGLHSLHLIDLSIFGIVATGTLTNGKILANLDPALGNSHTVPGDPLWSTPLTQRPDSLVGWYKGKPAPGDFPTAKALLHTDYAALPQEDSSTWIGVAYIELSPNEVDVWTRFSTPFEYFNDNTPEYILSILTAGNGLSAIAGSEVWFDDLKLIYNNSSVDELNAEYVHIYSRYGNLNVLLDEDLGRNAKIFVTDLSGRQVYKNNEVMTGENYEFKINAQKGIYLVTVQAENKSYSKKIWLQ